MQLWPGQYSSAVAVTPSDTTLISCRALYIGTSTTDTQALAINPAQTGGTTVTFANVKQGSILPLELNQGRVMAATTATTIIALS